MERWCSVLHERIYTGNGNLIPIAFRIEYESIFNKEIREKGRARSGVEAKRNANTPIHLIFCFVSLCVRVLRAVCFLFQKCAWMFVLPMKINAHRFSIKNGVNLWNWNEWKTVRFHTAAPRKYFRFSIILFTCGKSMNEVLVISNLFFQTRYHAETETQNMKHNE